LRPIEAFTTRYAFDLDEFQVKAIEGLSQGRSVLVAAPTGSGKTVVGEFSVWLALEEGGKAFYTTPLKALSNQKFGDFVALHGAGRVGLLTGDNSINAQAPAVVMTTEVLRNMIYEGSDLLNDLRYVVLDEVHYLQDRYRGAVWEEVIIHLPVDVKIVCLSATVSNAEEFAAWIQTVRGPTDVIIEERRPVELQQHYLLEGSLYPMFSDQGGHVSPNPEIKRVERRSRSKAYRQRGRRRGRPSVYRSDVVELLGDRDLLPAIYFIFSRKGCDMAVTQCLSDGIRLTNGSERKTIRDFAEMRCSFLDEADLAVLGYDQWIEGLSYGIASHHAGLIPPFKETVEELFQAGLLKVVFATETLSLGINMPARSVFIESLVKFTGERHEPMTAGDFTQLTGRAGRRGIDVLGHAVVPQQRDVPFEQLAGLASTRTFPLVSSFDPSYNMAMNLVRNYSVDEAEHLLNSSFAQYHADKDVVVLERSIERNEAYLASYKEKMRCHLGDFEEYRQQRDQIRRLEGARDRKSRSSAPRMTRKLMQSLAPGQVLSIRGGGEPRKVVVLFIEEAGRSESRPVALDENGRTIRLSSRDVIELSHPEAKIPVHPGMRRGRVPPGVRKELSRRLRELSMPKTEVVDVDAGKEEGDELRRLQEELAQHPCSDCPDLQRHIQWAERAARLERESESLSKRVRSRTETLARKFERVLEILREHECLKAFALTAKGLLLARIYNENDLLLTEVLSQDWFKDLEPAELAALMSAFVYESRGPGEDRRGMPTSATRAIFRKIDRMAERLKSRERELGLELTRGVESGFSQTIYGWCRGAALEDVIEDLDAAPGDFIRSSKQTLDLMKQVSESLDEESSLTRVLVSAINQIDRGVVSYTGMI
jgi:ATP-dependent RNA helicase HelY